MLPTDDDALIFFEPLVSTSYETVVPHWGHVDFQPGGPGGLDYANRSVLSYHSYCANNAEGAPAPMGLCRKMISDAWEGVRGPRLPRLQQMAEWLFSGGRPYLWHTSKSGRGVVH